jgi:hypothetical protein
VSVIAQEFLLRWSTAIPPPMTSLEDAIQSSWLPHMALVAWIAAGTLLRQASDSSTRIDPI